MAAVGQGKPAGVEISEVFLDNLAQFGWVVDLRHEVDLDLAAGPTQDAVALSELAVVSMVVAVVVVGGVWIVVEVVSRFSQQMLSSETGSAGPVAIGAGGTTPPGPEVSGLVRVDNVTEKVVEGRGKDDVSTSVLPCLDLLPK